MELKINRRQFILTNCPELEITEFIKSRINNWELYLEESLKLNEFNLNNSKCIVLGNPITYENFCSRISTEQIKDPIVKKTYFFSGKWAMLYEHKIYCDPTGLMGIYYCSFIKNSNEYSAISSTPSLLKKYIPGKNYREDDRHIEWGRSDGMEWYPVPGTKFDGIKKLLPSQVLCLETLQPHYLNRYNINLYKKLKYEEKINLIGDYLRIITEMISLRHQRVLIALTSGNDSRLILSAFLTRGGKVETFTFKYPGISRGDIKIPVKISKKLRLKHHFVDRSTEINKSYSGILDMHNSRIVDDGEKYFLIYNQFTDLNLNPDDVIVRTSVSDLFRLLYRDRLSDNNHIWGNKQISEILNAYRTRNPTVLTLQGLTEWISWHKDNNTENVDWRDIFYIEQRICGWMSGNELSMDIFDFSSIQPMNSQYIIDISLSFKDIERDAKDYKHGKIEPDIIRYLFPELLKFPLNPPDYYKKIKNRIIKLVKSR